MKYADIRVHVSAGAFPFPPVPDLWATQEF